MFQVDWIKMWADYTPERIAIEDAHTGQCFSYQDYFQYSCRLANHIKQEYNVSEGDRIAVLSTNEVEYFFLFDAIKRIGAIMAPINFRLTPPEISYILKDCQSSLFIHQQQYTETIQQIENVAIPKQVMEFDGPQGIHKIISDSNISDLELTMVGDLDTSCLILYTSGTTGFPKGVIISHGVMFWNSISTGLRLNLTQDDVTLSFLPFFHTGGWNVLTTPFLHRGAKQVFMRKFDPDQVLSLCDEKQVSILFGVPTTLDVMARTNTFQKVNLDSVRYAIVGGEPMPIELIKVWEDKGVPIRQGFGLTEFGPNVFSLSEKDSLRKIGSIGLPNFYIDVKIIDENGIEIDEADQIGELALRGPACTQGYWNNPDATAKTIRAGWLYTGDMVKRDEEGYYYVAGRKKDMYISGGENVYPAEIEQVISSHENIHEAAVIGVSHDQWGEAGKAFVVLEEGAHLTAEQVLVYCRERLAKFKTPRYVKFVSELPKGDSGKILKRKLNR